MSHSPRTIKNTKNPPLQIGNLAEKEHSLEELENSRKDLELLLEPSLSEPPGLGNTLSPMKKTFSGSPTRRSTYKDTNRSNIRSVRINNEIIDI